jgi:hypothetical protein
MPISFQEFLRKKAEGSGWKGRNDRRVEWLGALNRLLAQIRGFLQEADSDGVLEIVDYEVERVEERLGVYDAPALKIRLGTASVDVVPVGRNSPKPLSLMHLLAVQGNESRWGDLAGGRVDVTDGERRHLLLRSTKDGQDNWYVVMDKKSGVTPFDRQSLEAILQDLLS